jgi:inosine-uridine nucleoside N-ribohydrolase
MTGIWVDTDFGFDDLWALLVLRHLGGTVAGISLVAGNAPLSRVISNAVGAKQAYGFDAPIYAGAARPLVREPETAERVLSARGMLSRGQHLLDVTVERSLPPAAGGLRQWLGSGPDGAPRVVLAIGPLTNIAEIVRTAPELTQKITRLIWMGGSDGPGNHSPEAEFNALADPEAAAVVAQSGLPLEVIDLMVCRKVLFGPDDLPQSDDLTSDLLGGYLDIALTRGRTKMAIYDPIAALVAMQPDAFEYRRCAMTVSVTPDATYGKTTFGASTEGQTRLVVGPSADAMQTCLAALAGDNTHVA